MEISYKYLSRWSNPTEEEISRLCLCHIFINFQICRHHKQKKTTQFLLLAVNISCQGLVPALHSTVSFKSSPQDLKSSLQRILWQVPLLFVKKSKSVEMTTFSHSLSIVVNFSTTRGHSRSLDVSLVCLFLNDSARDLIQLKSN